MNREQILVKSEFNSSSCHKFALFTYIFTFIYSLLLVCILSHFIDMFLCFLVSLILTIFIGGLAHIIFYFTSRNNEITLTNYKIIGTYNRRRSLNIPIDSVSSVAKGYNSSLHITCAGNTYKIYFVSNRDVFCSKLTEILSLRAQQVLNNSSFGIDKINNYDEIVKLKQLLDDDIITQEEFNEKKRQLLGL